jgi:predicted dehydrogenase
VTGLATTRTRPRLGFLGVGWIGRHRMRALAQSGAVDVAAIADPAPDCLEEASRDAAGAHVAGDLEELLQAGIDALVIATPSALHADQAIAALEAGLAVFCQKPLARTREETERVVDAARAADRLLGVDFSYRNTAAARAVREQVAAGKLGPVHAAELVFHNAYGPDKPWFLDPQLSGGGCAIDLGTHLVDQLLWTLGFPAVTGVEARLWHQGRPPGPAEVEDFCLAELDLAGGTRARLACSWFSHEGRDAVIEVTLRGRDAAATMTNVGGSFYDFRAERREGTVARPLAEPPDEWGGRAAVDWARRLAEGARYDPEIEHALDVAGAIDGVYGR